MTGIHGTRISIGAESRWATVRRSSDQRKRPKREAVLDVVEVLHRFIGGAIARGDWVRTVAMLEVLGDVHRHADTGFARMTYARAARIAQEERLASTTRLQAKLQGEEGDI